MPLLFLCSLKVGRRGTIKHRLVIDCTGLTQMAFEKGKAVDWEGLA